MVRAEPSLGRFCRAWPRKPSEPVNWADQFDHAHDSSSPSITNSANNTFHPSHQISTPQPGPASPPTTSDSTLGGARAGMVLPPELLDHVLSLLPPHQLQQHTLTLTRALPHANISRALLWRHLVLTREGQAWLASYELRGEGEALKGAVRSVDVQVWRLVASIAACGVVKLRRESSRAD